MCASSAQRSMPKLLKVFATQLAISAIFKESRELGVLKSMIAKTRGGFLGDPILEMDALHEQGNCTRDIAPTGCHCLRHVDIHELLHQAVAN